MTAEYDCNVPMGRFIICGADSMKTLTKTTKMPMQDLVSDQRGAIMMMGLAPACLLIGALWFLIGVADTILWRDKMQEAVDAAAFSSATIHARGMNFVAAINLILLALVTIHVTLGIVADALSIVAAICLIPPLDPAAPVVYRAAMAVRKAQSGYDKFMWVANHALNVAQTGTAIASHRRHHPRAHRKGPRASEPRRGDHPLRPMHQRRTRRAGKRGAAMVEGAVVLPMLAVFFGVMMFVHDVAMTKLEIRSDTRNAAFSSAAHSCIARSGSEAEATLTRSPSCAGGGARSACPRRSSSRPRFRREPRRCPSR